MLDTPHWVQHLLPLDATTIMEDLDGTTSGAEVSLHSVAHSGRDTSQDAVSANSYSYP